MACTIFKCATALTQTESALGNNSNEKRSTPSVKTSESHVRHLTAELPISIKRLDWDIKEGCVDP